MAFDLLAFELEKSGRRVGGSFLIVVIGAQDLIGETANCINPAILTITNLSGDYGVNVHGLALHRDY